MEELTMDAKYFETFEKIWAEIWVLIDKIMVAIFGADYKKVEETK